MGFQTQQLHVGHTSSPFLTSTTAVFLKAAVPRSLLAYASSTLIFIHAQIKLLLTVNGNCSHHSGLWQPVALVSSSLGMVFEYTVIYHFKVSLDKLSSTTCHPHLVSLSPSLRHSTSPCAFSQPLFIFGLCLHLARGLHHRQFFYFFLN